LGIFSGILAPQMTRALPLLRDPHTSRSLTNHSLAMYKPSVNIAPPFPCPIQVSPLGGEAACGVWGDCCFEPQPCLRPSPRRPRPPLADPHRPRPLLPEIKRLPLSVRARVPLAAQHTRRPADFQGGHFSHWCSFPEPSSSHHSQRRRRPRCPPTRNGWTACWRRTGSLCCRTSGSCS